MHQPTAEHPAPLTEPEDLEPAEPEPAPEPRPAEPASAEEDLEIGEIELELDDEFEEFREPDGEESG
ncbi:MAG: SHD1 domain-containing protein, partial [Solirubrobacterales bacterium]